MDMRQKMSIMTIRTHLGRIHRSEVENEVFPTPEEPKPNKTDFTLALPYIQAPLPGMLQTN